MDMEQKPRLCQQKNVIFSAAAGLLEQANSFNLTFLTSK